MAWFMIRLEGEGPEVKIVGDQPVLGGLFTVKKKLTVTGFYATRYIEAVDADTAIDLVSSSIKSDLAEALPESCRSWGNLVLRVDGIETVDPKDVDANARGFTFF